MCGFLASITRSVHPHSRLQAALLRMRARGPDGEGVWHEPGAWLGHRRLAVLDLDARAAQPMHSSCGRYVIVYNGEIYNFRELRNALERTGTVLRTQGDTEVLLELYASEGEAMLPKLRGMFAFVIWDKLEKCAFAARDPYGIKPLYLARTADGWLLGSQVKALLATGQVATDPDPYGQAGFWLLGSVPEPHTWYRDIRALPAGSYCRIDAEGILHGPHNWLDIGDTWRQAPTCDVRADEAQDLIRTGVLQSVRRHLVADVAVGVFLSGGIDSASLAGLMRDAGATDVQGITVAFREFAGTRQDETPMAARIARQYGIAHHVRTVTREEFESDLPRIMSAMDQPSIDGINTWYASKAAAEKGLKVVVSGVGGDELFYGYPGFQQIPALVARWQRLQRIPCGRMAANLLGHALTWRTRNPRWRWLTRQAADLHGAYWLRRGLYSPDQLPALMDSALAREWMGAMDPAGLVRASAGALPQDPQAAVGLLESKAYLRNQLLRDSDWASMDHGVELRTPLVDARLLHDLSPILRGFGHMHGKAMLARAPCSPLPADIIHRRKSGFGIPVEHWMRPTPDPRHAQGGSRGWARWVADHYDRPVKAP